METSPETGCCPRFDPGPWKETEFEWHDRLFVRVRVRSFFHIPLNFGGVMKRTMQRVEAAGAADPEPMVLADENSLWGADVFVAVDKDVPGMEMSRLSGTFFAKAFEGPYSQVRHWCKDMSATLKAQGREAKRTLFWYTTCPRCAKAYGANHVVVLAQV